jgi:biotin carboxyl carrier protein
MSREYKILMEDEEQTIQVKPEGDSFVVTLGNSTHRLTPLADRAPLYSFLVDERKVLEAEIVLDQDRCEMTVGHIPYSLEVFDPRQQRVSQSQFDPGGGGLIAAPMPGKVVDVKVGVGDTVKKGQAIVIVEAMKMQNELYSSLDGKVKEVTVKTGDTVESGQKMVVISKD